MNYMFTLLSSLLWALFRRPESRIVRRVNGNVVKGSNTWTTFSQLNTLKCSIKFNYLWTLEPFNLNCVSLGSNICVAEGKGFWGCLIYDSIKIGRIASRDCYQIRGTCPCKVPNPSRGWVYYESYKKLLCFLRKKNPSRCMNDFIGDEKVWFKVSTFLLPKKCQNASRLKQRKSQFIIC